MILEVNGYLIMTTTAINMVICEQNQGIIVVTCNFAPWIHIMRNIAQNRIYLSLHEIHMLYLSMLICLFVYIPMVAIPKHLDDWFPRCLIVVVAFRLSTMLSMYCGGRFTHQSFITIPAWGDHPFDLIIASSALCRIGVLTLF